jgi:hypothetical protein
MPPPAQSTAPRHPGPPLLMPGGIFVALRIASFASLVIMTGFAPYPIPFNPGDGSRYFVEHAKAVQIAAFIQFGAAIPLGLFTATLASRLRFLGIEAAGVTIALFGGFAASFFLGCSALVQWVLAFPGVADDPPNARVLQLLAFATGGPGHVVRARTSGRRCVNHRRSYETHPALADVLRHRARARRRTVDLGADP